MTGIRKGFYVAAAVGALTGSLLGLSQTAHAAGPPVFDLSPVGAFGGEPSLTSDTNGVLYATTPSGPQTYRSTDKGATWTNIQSPDNNSGDDCLNTDSQNSLYWCNLASTTKGNLPLQADVWKSTASHITTCTASCSWQYGNNATTAGTCSTSCNPFGVDRQWVASSITGHAPSTDTAHALVVLMYHDFYGPSHIWVNVSTDGGATFGTAQEVLSGGFTNNPNGTVTAEGYTFCNTVPAGVGIAPPGHAACRSHLRLLDRVRPRAGRHRLQHLHGPVLPHRVDRVLRRQGRHLEPADGLRLRHRPRHVDAVRRLHARQPGQPLHRIRHPGAEPEPGDLLLRHRCRDCPERQGLRLQRVRGLVARRRQHLGRGGGSLPDPAGSAATAYRANPTSETGTDVFPTIAAGDPGKVDVGYLHTDSIVPTSPLGKFMPGGCAGGTTNFPARCHWNLETSQSLNLNNTPATATFTKVQATSTPMHYGDICNLGIACPPTTPDARHLLDFNQETVDPTTGCAHIVYADDNAGSTYGDPAAPSPFGNHLVSANQVDGPSIIGSGLCGAAVITPEVPLSLLLPLAGAGVIVAVGIRRRRRGSSPLPV